MTADALGNTPRVAGTNYVPITPEIKAKGASFMDGMVERLSAALKAKRMSASSPDAAKSEATPVSACRDTLHGDFAPNDGFNHCDSWVNCLFCTQCAITGEEDDLWRLFSFRDFAKNDLHRLVQRHGEGPSGDARTDLLKVQYRLIIPFIGSFARANFVDRVVHRAERRALAEPHPFWVYQEELAGLRR
ncbi:MAG: hypothetical protein JSR75_19760 [Proteobacteria bacterium]|nr:hypothetical protein [Pseudomonadota bacterium]